MKRNLLRIISMILLTSILLCGCGGEKNQTITSNGLTMTIPASMKDITEDSGYTFAYASNKQPVIGLYEEKSIFLSYGLDLTLEEYCDLVIQGNSLDAAPTEVNGLLTFRFDSVVNGETYSYLAAVFENTDAFWLIQCSSKSADFDGYYENFLNYLGSVQP